MDLRLFDNLNLNEISTIFNEQINEFLDQIQIIIDPLVEKNILDKRSKANVDFYKNLIQKCLSLNKEIVIESFGAFILRENIIVSKIIEKDVDYFVNLDCSAICDDKNIIELINIIKNIIQFLSDDNKSICFEYLNNLCQITLSYVKKKYNN